MKKVLLAFVLFTGCLTSFSQSVKHVILISIDGFRPEMYQDKCWPTPNLQVLMKEGTYARHLKSVFPAYTYPSHTAMLTGALPARSGICYNQPKNSKGEWSWFTDSVKVPMIWQILKQHHLTSAVIEWPVSVHAPADYAIPEIWDVDHPDDRITYTRKFSTPGLIEEIERNATGKLDSTNMSDGFFSLDENSARMAAYIIRTYKPNFLAVHLAEVDDMQHNYGREHDSVRLAVASNDRAIGDIMEAIQRSGIRDSTTVIIVGDHGFCDINQVFRPNILIKDIPARFMAAGGSAFLYAKDNTPTPQLIKDVITKLEQLPSDKRKLFRIVDRKELDKMGADSSALLALAAVPGLVFSGSMGSAKTTNNGPGTLIQQSSLEGVFFPINKAGHHGYDPNIPEMYTGFIASGAGVNKGAVIEEISEPDIAPLIAKLLGFEFNTPDGKLVPGIIR